MSHGFAVDLHLNADRREMWEAIRDFGSELVKGGTGLFFYAGHGMQVNGRNYLVPIGADIRAEDEVQFSSIDAGLVIGKMESAGNDTNIVILDACRDNPFKRSFRSSSRGLSVIEAPRGTLVVYATAPGAVAADGDGNNGVLTEALLTTIDTAIEKTESLIEKYRKIKTGLMNDLFTRGIGPDGKLRPLRSQAPELYKKTELGWIPREWEVVTVGDLFFVQLGKMLS